MFLHIKLFGKQREVFQRFFISGKTHTVAKICKESGVDEWHQIIKERLLHYPFIFISPAPSSYILKTCAACFKKWKSL